MMKIAVVIPSFNRCELLQRLLYQIYEQLPEKDFIVVVNDGSSDGTSSMLAETFPQAIEVIGDGNWWYTRSINEGIKRALEEGPSHILMLNDDIELDAQYFEKMIDGAQKQDKDTIIGSLSVTYEEPHLLTFSGVKDFQWWRYRSVDYHPIFQPIDLVDFKGLVPSVILPGRGMLIPVSILEEIGLLNEDYIQYGSDDEICLRARKKGHPVMVNWEAVVYSHHRLTGSGSSFVKESLGSHLRSYLSPYSRNYWRKYVKNIFTYGNKLLFPLTMAIVVLGNLKSFLNFRLKDHE
ncbi:glycosyltransferase family 2 protein [Roseivirga misakiensis]|uniref:Glycosyltransferase 2-like domain-containing protein n=1 Tax=Roseivirga misakiensis TaxID=1563681 RepID=A0A1E5T5V8_9BACT|nr:glycosyltransferase family 2 protein [Roseivirga misakiensis]OEK06774.1 hypothetical protein BFP71_03685 [Roseivirga misakiensis]